MKKEIHPEDYRPVVFKDMSNDYAFMTKSTAPSKETIKWEDGKSLSDNSERLFFFSYVNGFNGRLNRSCSA